MPRLFTGLELPEDVKEELAGISAPLPGASWIDPDDLHVTLRFAGDIDGRTAKDFRLNLEAITADAFTLKFSRLGVFGGKQPRTLWIGFEPSEALEALARANDRAARGAGLPFERQSFKAHVTLARLRGTRAEDVARFIETAPALPPIELYVDHFVLYSSRPKVGGGPYVVEEEYPLGGYGLDHEESDVTNW